MKRFGKRCLVWGAALLFYAGCADSDRAPLGPDENGGDNEVPAAALARLACVVDVAAGTMTCDTPTPDHGKFGASADLIVGGQHQFVRMANDTPQVVADVWTANVTVQNLMIQPMGTVDGTTVSPEGVRVFFVDQPNNGVQILNADGSAAFTGSDPQPFYAYTDVLLGTDSILSQGETSSSKEWQFQLNGASTFRFSVLISTDVPDETNFGVHLTDVSSAEFHTCGDGNDGVIYCWGVNEFGRLGDGTDTDRPVPTAVAAFGGLMLSGVAAGINHTCANGSDDQVYCWGSSQYGQLGNGTSGAAAMSSTPVQVSAPVDVQLSAVTAGEHHTCAMGSDDNVYCWGRNNFGQLGDTLALQSAVPIAVSAPVGVTLSAVSAGWNHTCALGSDDNAYCWGRNEFGQLGDSTTTASPTPVQVKAPAGVSFTSIVANHSHTCALGSDGNAYCWGDNANGQLGDGTQDESWIPVAVQAGGRQFIEISGGFQHTCAIDTSNKAFCWGVNNSGQVGNGTLGASYSTPQQTFDFTPDLTYSNIEVGGHHACAIGSDGKTYCWGRNTSNQLGDGRASLGSVNPHPVAGTRRP